MLEFNFTLVDERGPWNLWENVNATGHDKAQAIWRFAGIKLADEYLLYYNPSVILILCYILMD